MTQDATALAFASHKLRCDPDVFETAMASQGSRYGWGDSPKRSPTKSSSMEFPAPLSPKGGGPRAVAASEGAGRRAARVGGLGGSGYWLSFTAPLFITAHLLSPQHLAGAGNPRERERTIDVSGYRVKPQPDVEAESSAAAITVNSPSCLPAASARYT